MENLLPRRSSCYLFTNNVVTIQLQKIIKLMKGKMKYEEILIQISIKNKITFWKFKVVRF